ncbi:MarR family winged helix-turn-helix transcriptional regulator [Roseibium sp.]|uniref:MarR family winged helix-turn-helix transcriptional regulator n=1 Tax=Roseibium sp. TaxID=1936156 RepID=UPI003B52AB5D
MKSSSPNGREGGSEYNKLWNMASYLINRISHRYNKNVHGELKAIGLTTLNVRIVACLKTFEQLTINELCVHAIAEQPTMSRALDRLEQEGLVSRVIRDDDGRSRVVQLTPKGAAMYVDIMPVLRGANEDLLAALDPDERAQFMSLLTRVLKQIRENPI